MSYKIDKQSHISSIAEDKKFDDEIRELASILIECFLEVENGKPKTN